MKKKVYTHADIKKIQKRHKKRIAIIFALFLIICATSVFNTIKLIELHQDYKRAIRIIEERRGAVVKKVERTTQDVAVHEAGATAFASQDGRGEAKASPAVEEWDGVGNFSAYTASIDECGKDDGITASGALVQVNHTIACPPGYDFGTQIMVEGYGAYTCEDRGGAIKGNKFDIYMETKPEAFGFGRKELRFYVI